MPVRAKTSFSVPAAEAGRNRAVSEGDVFADDDPITEGREELFEPAEVYLARVEAATANPGVPRDLPITSAKHVRKTSKKKETTK